MASWKPRKRNRSPIDGEMTTACASLVRQMPFIFGDIKDPESKVAKLLQLEDKGDSSRSMSTGHIMYLKI